MPKKIIFMTAVAVSVIVINIHIVSFSREYMVIPDKKLFCAIVPGARVYSSGVISDIYMDRLLTAVELYKSGKVNLIFISADNRKSHNYETDAAVTFLKSQQIRPLDISADPAGYTTFDTMINAEKTGIKNGIVVTQRYHLYRSVYIARSAGIDCYGSASDRQSYKSMKFFMAREYFARIKAFIMITLMNNKSKTAQTKN